MELAGGREEVTSKSSLQLRAKVVIVTLASFFFLKPFLVLCGMDLQTFAHHILLHRWWTVIKIHYLIDLTCSAA